MTTLLLTAGVFLCAWVHPQWARADSDYLYGIHWWGYDGSMPIDPVPASLLDCPTYGGWDVETILTHSAYWWSAAYFQPLYQDLYTNKNMGLITRIDYDWGQTVPAPSNPDYAGWPTNVLGVVNTLRNYCHIWQLGNEPNLLGEGNGWTDNQILPTAYATIYRNVRNAIQAGAGTSPAGTHQLLIAAPSPGGIVSDVRWISSEDWLQQVISNIPADEIDGFAIHAYGGTLTEAMLQVQAQLQVIDGAGLYDKPIYMTEWNRYSDPNNPIQEKDAAQFCREAFAALNNWNQTEGNHNIVCMAWFVYDGDDQGGGGWNGYSIEYWKDHGIYGSGNQNDLYTAYEQTVDLRYPAGYPGVLMLLADFTATPLRGPAPLTVAFTDDSYGPVSAYSWTFGDGGTSAAGNPTHQYTGPGDYTVSLTVAGGGLTPSTVTRTAYIEVWQPIPADFNDDRYVDFADLAIFAGCISAPNISYGAGCSEADLDGDGDVDQADYARFQRCYSDDQYAEATCAD